MEDNPGDVRLTQVAFEEAGVDYRLHVVTTGADAIDFLDGGDEEGPVPRPDLVFLDLNLPRKDGIEVLQAIRGDLELRRLPVLVLTSSLASEDILECYANYANAYLTKPDTIDEFVSLIRAVETFWLEEAQLPF